jgi:hypothetical protein
MKKVGKTYVVNVKKWNAQNNNVLNNTYRHFGNVADCGDNRAPDSKLPRRPLLWTCLYGELESHFRHV